MFGDSCFELKSTFPHFVLLFWWENQAFSYSKTHVFWGGVRRASRQDDSAVKYEKKVDSENCLRTNTWGFP